MKTQNPEIKSLISRIFLVKKGNSRKKTVKLLLSQEKIKSMYQDMLANLTAMIFTGTLFLGGSYLFFVQLAEYGW